VAERGAFAITAPLVPGENVFGPGSRHARGNLLVPAGVPLTPQALGLLAGQGLAEASVVRRPRVALLALGDELVEPGSPRQPGQIYVSNLYALEAEARAQGADAVNLGIAPDDADAIAARLAPRVDGHDAADVLITLGGSHRGDFDFAGDIFARLGARLVFQRTLINWGGSTLFATRARGGGTQLCFGLPGTPLASWLAFELLARPSLWVLSGRAATDRRVLRARLTAPLKRRSGRAHFIPARLDFRAEAVPLATPLDEKPTPERPSAPLAGGLILYPDGTEGLDAGAEVSVMWLGG
jgi:molybdopterin molybdotransferase